jgi:hypothetical protein
MGYDFTFDYTIETGPICTTVVVLCEYTPAGQHTAASVEYLMFEPDAGDVLAVGSLWPAMREWIEKTYFFDGTTILESFRKEALAEARKLGMDKYDEEAANRFTGFSKRACGYR